ncbi:SAF domain-containing protein [Isoptericola croceus]|uniref:SAF domain-containing protein n=1 Tax=Isoptericola croceus TaxID=3031406 RepID=UPI0023F73532|nr:SAF domain-containing protein [Isoptericola croceus]
MTTTVPADATRAPWRRPDSGDGPAGAPSVAPPPKLRRRPVLIVAGVAAICLGALLSLWAYSSTSEAQSVLAMRHTIERGQVITANDVMTVQIGLDPALQALPASDLDSVIGMRAALDLPAGGLVTAEQVTDSPIPADGTSVVGISLAAGQLPVGQVRVGDTVRIVTTEGEVEAVQAEVVDVAADDLSGTTILNVQVDYDDAPEVAARAASGKVAIVLDPDLEG